MIQLLVAELRYSGLSDKGIEKFFHSVIFYKQERGVVWRSNVLRRAIGLRFVAIVTMISIN